LPHCLLRAAPGGLPLALPDTGGFAVLAILLGLQQVLRPDHGIEIATRWGAYRSIEEKT